MGYSAPERKRFTVDGIDDVALVTGSGRIPFVWIGGNHLGPEDYGAFADTATQAEKYTLYRVPRKPGDLTVEEHVAYTMKVIADLKIKPPFVIGGHSLGGAIALVLAAKHPKQVQGVVVFNPQVGPADFQKASTDTASISELIGRSITDTRAGTTLFRLTVLGPNRKTNHNSTCATLDISGYAEDLAKNGTRIYAVLSREDEITPPDDTIRFLVAVEQQQEALGLDERVLVWRTRHYHLASVVMGSDLDPALLEGLNRMETPVVALAVARQPDGLALAITQ